MNIMTHTRKRKAAVIKIIDALLSIALQVEYS